MARIRQISPLFFIHELTGDQLTVVEAMSFVGLWTQADAAGRLEERHGRLKAALWPNGARLSRDGGQVPVDMKAVIDRLVDVGLIVRYRGRALEHDRKKKGNPKPVGDALALLYVPKFKKHQNPHPKERINYEAPEDVQAAFDLTTGEVFESVAGVPVDRLRYDGPEHKPHAVCGRVCLPEFLCDQFARQLGGEKPRDRVIAWALVMLRAAASLDAPIALPPVDWWRDAFKAHVAGLTEAAKAGEAAKGNR